MAGEAALVSEALLRSCRSSPEIGGQAFAESPCGAAQ
jgi:hypothetical protein